MLLDSPTIVPEVKRVKQAEFERYAPTTADGCVYFIQAAGGGLVKVGTTTNKPVLRLRALQLCCPVPLRLVAVIEGTTEAEMHRLFDAQRAYGEWFKPKGEVTEFMRRLADAPEVEWTTAKKLRTERPPWARVLTVRRVALGVSQTALAELTQAGRDGAKGLSQRTISCLEAGEISPTSLTTLRFNAYLSALSWTVTDFEAATGLRASLA